MKLFPAFLALLLLAGCEVNVTETKLLPDMLYDPDAPIKEAPEEYIVTDTMLDLGDLGVVHVVFMDNPNSTGTHVYSGGRRYLTTRPTKRAIRLAELTNADLVFYDYPGRYGTTVEKTVPALLDFGPAFMDALEAKGWIQGGPLYAHGYSFGGAMAASIVRSGGFDGIILENTTSDVTGYVLGPIPRILRPFTRVKLDGDINDFDYFNYIADAGIPVLLFSGRKDTVVDEGLVDDFNEKLLEADVGTTYIVTPAGHGNAIYTEEAAEAFRDFYKK